MQDVIREQVFFTASPVPRVAVSLLDRVSVSSRLRVSVSACPHVISSQGRVAKPLFWPSANLVCPLFQIYPNSVQNPVYEGTGILCAIFLAKIHRFVYGNLSRDICSVKDFKNGQSENIAVDRRHALQPPML